MNNEHFMEVMALWGFFGGSCFVVWTIANTIKSNRMARERAEMQNRILDKISTNQELASFMQSEAGQKLWDAGSSNGATLPFKKILNSVQAGLVLTLVGGAMVLLSSGRPQETGDPLLIPGTIALAMGIGFLLSASASYFLSKSLGLMQHDSTPKR